jgi:hypothetical protein
MVCLTLSVSSTAAYDALIEAALEIALEHGEARALAWAEKILAADMELFFVTQVERRPSLRLINGGKAAAS